MVALVNSEWVTGMVRDGFWPFHSEVAMMTGKIFEAAQEISAPWRESDTRRRV
jgi:hypothetical protein